MASAYTEAWKPWDDRLADHVIAKRNWQLAFGAMTAVALALTVCVMWLSARIRYVAYAVEVDKLGYALALPQPLTPITGKPDEMVLRMERYEVGQYIRNLRCISSDVMVEQQAVDSVYKHTVFQSAADRFLSSYFGHEEGAVDPFALGRKETVSVQITSLLPLSPKTWQVRWREDTRDLNGAALGTPTYWEAQVQIEFVAPKNGAEILINPLGLFVENLTWSEEARQ
jgi:type IV secretory pathway TrbF-like protein